MTFNSLGWSMMIIRICKKKIMIFLSCCVFATWRRVLRTLSLTKREFPKWRILDMYYNFLWCTFLWHTRSLPTCRDPLWPWRVFVKGWKIKRNRCSWNQPRSTQGVSRSHSISPRMIFNALGWSMMIFRNCKQIMILLSCCVSVTWRRVLRTLSLTKREFPKS